MFQDMTGWLTLIGVIIFLSFILGPRMLIALLIVVVLMAFQAWRANKKFSSIRSWFSKKTSDHK